MKMRIGLRQFFENQAAGGVVMLIAAALAMLFANNSYSTLYQDFIHAPLPADLNVHVAVADMLMPIFFLFVGLELKHEMQHGTLADARQRILPLVGALGGIVVPALLYLFITDSEPLLRAGWAIPTATDIAFAICIVNLVGSRVSPAAKIFLLAIAIYDDLAAIIIIALFYTGALAMVPLAAAFGIIAAMVLLNRYTSAPPLPMMLLGAVLGWLLYQAGIHTTVAGMITGLCIAGPHVKTTLTRLHPLVVFGILPLFAFVSAGVDLSGVDTSHLLTPLPLGIAAGLFFGKQIGIVGATLLAVACGLASLPSGMTRRALHGVATVAGIGFTMSLFIGQLAFADAALQDALKIGVLGGSAISAVVGYLLLRSLPRPA